MTKFRILSIAAQELAGAMEYYETKFEKCSSDNEFATFTGRIELPWAITYQPLPKSSKSC